MKRRLFTEVAIASVRFTFSHSLIRRFFEAVNSSSKKESARRESNLFLSQLSKLEATKFKTLSIVFVAILAAWND